MQLSCLVDNTVKQGSPLWGEHGLSMLLDTPDGRVLFDTGSSGTVLIHNLMDRAIETRTFGSCVLSHGHYDHTGGLADLLERRPGLDIYANSGVMRERFVTKDGTTTGIGLRIKPDELQRQSRLHMADVPQQVLPGVWTTGVITTRTEPEGRGANHMVRAADGTRLVPDSYEDDLSLVIQRPQGWVLVCGCCHAGLLNTLAHVRKTFGAYPTTVVGGTHLVSADAAQLKHVIEVLRPLGPPVLYLNHCTGQAAFVALATAFGDRVRPFSAGSILEL